MAIKKHTEVAAEILTLVMDREFNTFTNDSEMIVIIGKMIQDNHEEAVAEALRLAEWDTGIAP